MASNDFRFPSKEKKKSSPRAYIGNLRVCPDIKTKLLFLIHEKGFGKITEDDIEVHQQKSCFALVLCSNVDRLIAKLNGVDFDGRKMVVQSEQKKAGTAKSSFGGGWARPTKSSPTPKEPMAVSVKPLQPTMVREEIAKDDSGEGVTSDDRDEVTLDDFRSRCQKPLTDLLAEFGEHDPNFKKVVPTLPSENEGSAKNSTAETDESNSRLGKFGKAPLHVEFCSFGYVFSAPSSQSQSHSQPLPPLDCRDLPTVPPYLAHKSGIAFDVKRVLLTDGLKTVAATLADQVLSALVDAISDGHGYALPLRMTIHVGSLNGRHRSVLVCEESAKGLRYRLRKNVNNRVRVDVSVGTTHSDMDRKREFGRPKHGESEDEW